MESINISAICALKLPVPVRVTIYLLARTGEVRWSSVRCGGLVVSVAEQPLFWAAPAPEVRGPGADSGFGSDQIGSAPAPGKKRRIQAATAPYTNSFHFELLKSELLMQVFLRSHLPL